PVNTTALITINGATATVAAAGNLTVARARHGAARLDSGQIVVIGGTSNQDTSGALASAEIFTVSTGQFQPFVNNLAEARVDPTLIVIADEVTVLGGRTSTNDGVQAAERLNTSNGVFSAPKFPDTVNRTESAAFVLGNGLHVIVGGGLAPSQFIPSQPIVAEAFRSGIGMPSATFGAPAFSFQGNTIDFYGGEDANGLKSTIEVFFFNEALTEIRGDLLVPRARHTIQRFDDIEVGRALIIGGRIAAGVTNTCEIADTTAGTSRAVPSLMFARENHRSVRLFDGRVLVVGGRDNSGTPLSSAEVFDPVLETWATVASLSTERADHQIAIVPTTGEVLVVGGVNAAGTRLNSAELFDPNTNTFRPVGNTMSRARQAPTLVTDGNLTTIAVVGGDDGTGPQANADIFDPVTSTFTSTIPMLIARSGGTSVSYSLGSALIVGGTDASGGDAGPELLELGTDSSMAAGRLPDDPSQLVRRRGAIAINVGGTVVLLGGRTPDGDVLSGLEFYVP
ncbi:MAG: kelch repeat-containing protein, partial [Planctomycetota bacterium]|nr:kelch repeat-containing protein [Planctomycetota bacterium]